MHKMLAAYNLDLALISGYLVYDYGQPTCYNFWDKFLTNWQSRFETDDFSLIPSIIGASKAEIGFQPFKQIEPETLSDNLFYTFFPFAKPMPPGKERLYYHHQIGRNISIFTLDPGFLDDFDSDSD